MNFTKFSILHYQRGRSTSSRSRYSINIFIAQENIPTEVVIILQRRRIIMYIQN